MPSDRNWQIDGDPFVVHPDELEIELHQATAILARIGGAIIVAAQREEIAPGHWVTTAYAFTWRSFAPAQRYQEPDTNGAVEPEAVTP
jgi:hypothetical protein